MYNRNMKKISVLLILALLCGFNVQTACQAGVLQNHKAKVAQNKLNKTTRNELKSIIELQTEIANKHDLDGLKKLYSKDFINSDGFNFDIYMQMVEDTWQTYPDIAYKTQIHSVDFSDNYATVLVTEIAVAAPKEQVGDYETIGELYSISKCLYTLEKHGSSWLINSEKMLEETSTLKYGSARYVDIELNTPKQIGANKYYTTTLKTNIPQDYAIVASISKENITYPQVAKSEEAFRRIEEDNILERVFLSNKDNVNEYAIASVGITNIRNNEVFMSGLAFIMTRVNVIPENKFVKEKPNEQSK
jgi:hypothetical protein